MGVQVTFTLDDATAELLRATAARLAKPQNEIVREAIRDYYTKTDRLSEEEKQRMLRLLRDYMKTPPTRSQRVVERELAEIRASRRRGGRRTRIE